LKFATDMGCSAFVAVSAKTSKNLKAVFEKAVSIVLQKQDSGGHNNPTPSNNSTDPDGPINITVVPKKNTAKRRDGGCVLI
jgi:hypothetical protein